MPYKRFSRVAWTFSISKFRQFWVEREFFNSHGIYQQLRIIWAKGVNIIRTALGLAIRGRLCATAYRIELLIESPIMVFPLADSAVGDRFGIVHTMVDRL